MLAADRQGDAVFDDAAAARHRRLGHVGVERRSGLRRAARRPAGGRPSSRPHDPIGWPLSYDCNMRAWPVVVILGAAALVGSGFVHLVHGGCDAAVRYATRPVVSVS